MLSQMRKGANINICSCPICGKESISIFGVVPNRERNYPIGIGVVQILSGANFPISTQIIVFVF